MIFESPVCCGLIVLVYHDTLCMLSYYTIHTSSSLTRRSRPLTRKNNHNAKSDIKQAQRIRHEASHRPHAAHGAKHATTAIRAPNDSRTTNHIPARAIHGRHNPHQTRKDQRQQTVSQHGRAARERQRARQHGRLLTMVVVHLRQ